VENTVVNSSDTPSGAALRRSRPGGFSRPRAAVIVAAIAALTITASTLTATPAHAEGVDAAAVEQVLRQAGAVTDVAATAAPKQASPDAAGVADRAPAVKSGASVTLKSGLTVPTGTNTLSITPVLERTALERSVLKRSGAAPTSEAKALSPSGLAVYANTADSAIAFSRASTGGNAGYAVITGANAPTSYRFAFAVDGKPAVLRPVDGGGIEVLSSTGAVVNSIAPAWAKDATGAEVPTSYSVNGNVLTQTVDHAGAAYPVVADPRLRCDSLWCTVELTRGETRSLAANVLYAGGPCAILGGGAPVCVTVLTGAWAMASIAISRGQCIGYRVWKANFVSYPHLAYVGCYA
jgi:hypothetical protein